MFMTKKKVLIGSIVGMMAGWTLLAVENFWFCRDTYRGYGLDECSYATQNDVVLMIEFISVPLFFVTILLFFVRDEIFNSWFRFAIIWLSLGALVIFFASSTNGGVMGSDRLWAAEFFFSTFLLWSFILVAYRIIQARRQIK